MNRACTIRCKACGWKKLVQRSDAGQRILYHRNIECKAGMPAPSHVPHGRGKWDRPHTTPPRFKGGRTQFCPTCRGELAIVNDARSCIAGCTNEARV